MFDPYSDDPRLAVKKLCLCPTTGLLAVAGTAGQIVVAELSDQTSEKELPVRLILSASALKTVFTRYFIVIGDLC